MEKKSNNLIYFLLSLVLFFYIPIFSMDGAASTPLSAAGAAAEPLEASLSSSFSIVACAAIIESKEIQDLFNQVDRLKTEAQLTKDTGLRAQKYHEATKIYTAILSLYITNYSDNPIVLQRKYRQIKNHIEEISKTQMIENKFFLYPPDYSDICIRAENILSTPETKSTLALQRQKINRERMVKRAMEKQTEALGCLQRCNKEYNKAFYKNKQAIALLLQAQQEGYLEVNDSIDRSLGMMQPICEAPEYQEQRNKLMEEITTQRPGFQSKSERFEGIQPLYATSCPTAFPPAPPTGNRQSHTSILKKQSHKSDKKPKAKE